MCARYFSENYFHSGTTENAGGREGRKRDFKTTDESLYLQKIQCMLYIGNQRPPLSNQNNGKPELHCTDTKSQNIAPCFAGISGNR